MIKLFLQYVCGVIFAFILWRCIFYVFVSLPTTFPNIAIITNLGVIIYLIAFLALPLVCPLGMYFVDKLIYKSTIHSAWKILFGFLTSIFGVVFFMRILPFFGVNTCDWIPVINGVDYADYVYSFIAALFSLIGYKGVGLFEYIKRNNRTKTDEKIEGLPPQNRRVFIGQILPIIILLIISLLIFLIIVCRSSTYRI